MAVSSFYTFVVCALLSVLCLTVLAQQDGEVGDDMEKRQYFDSLSGGAMGKRPYFDSLSSMALGKRQYFDSLGGIAFGKRHFDSLGGLALGKRSPRWSNRRFYDFSKK